jgi:23S rRNA (guanine745-N1)-methyltransferase
MFSPLAPDEVLRALKRGGIFVMAIPGVEHLFGLKAAAYDKPYKNTVLDSKIDGFELVSQENIKYRITLDGKDKIKSLFMMTPYAYRTGRVERERIFALDTLETDVEFIVFVYKKL